MLVIDSVKGKGDGEDPTAVMAGSHWLTSAAKLSHDLEQVPAERARRCRE